MNLFHSSPFKGKIMLMKMKVKIKELARTAVYQAEEMLGSSRGQEKKTMAIEYVLNKIPLPALFRPFVKILFSSFIDEAIELAVEYMKSEEL